MEITRAGTLKIKMATFPERAWKEAFLSVQKQFLIDHLLPEQVSAVKAFIEKGNVFVNLPTGYGKSLIFQCIPIVYDILYSRPRGTSVVVVISPLKALMKDQVEYLATFGVPAIAIGDEYDEETIQQVKNGYFLIVYCSPECLLSTSTWREIFNDADFREKLVGVAIDEAHCITEWGLSNSSKCPFRKWYGCLGELRSLIPQECKIMVLTATASKLTTEKILDAVNISRDTIMIQQSPDKVNISYTRQYLDKNYPIEKQFGALLGECQRLGINTPRTIIYCQTRKQCAILFRLFEVCLEEKLYHGSKDYRNRVVDMYHAGTPESVKEHVSEQMSNENGVIRVLISSIAFGMGVNCKQVRRVVHFGPSKSIESYIQECGRAGRDGVQSTCMLLYNGLLSVHCDNDMKHYLNHEGCLREKLLIHFGYKVDHKNFQFLHNCCSNCQQSLCGTSSCRKLWSPQLEQECDLDLYTTDEQEKSKLTRVVTKKDKKLLKEKLINYQREMLKEYNIKNMVTCPNMLLEFNMFHINQVLGSCHSLFTLNDVLKSVEIWRHKYAVEILRIIQDIFGDMEIEIPDDLEDSDEEETLTTEWEALRNDSSCLEIVNSQDLVAIESTMDTDTSYNNISI
ncbi:ATP-dependent DNA helicase Q-like 1 [Dendronephthya gigantea]|uniref:ATP-dependent DNA helicase Q-like 1 n=1 Tax=Dendronephthya gigantea TaxID=151771 RepID=UPI00106CA442|nr:ATP-dependent DNA helicase Q-like 1 [Dendronephthya gigantea]